MAKVLGVGGVFFKSDDGDKIGEWYQKWLGLPVTPPYGASFMPDALPPGSVTVWAPFKSDSEYFAPSDKQHMINLIVDDLDGALAQVAEGGAEVVGDLEEFEYGRFGWFIDPEGTKIELWEPKEVEEGDGDGNADDG